VFQPVEIFPLETEVAPTTHKIALGAL